MPSALFIATPERRAVWTRRVSENSPWWGLIKARALAGTSYSDWGLWGALAYQMTGDPQYAQRAWDRLSTVFFPATEAALDANSLREFGWQWVLALDWLWDWMDQDQRDLFVAELNTLLSTNLDGASLPADFKVRATDSDMMTGAYVTAAMLHARTASFNPVIVDLFATQRVGGFEATGVSPDCTTYRNAVRTYIELSKGNDKGGGEWIESTEYNPGTLKILALGIEALKTAGHDTFPEFGPFLDNLAEMFPLHLTPDRKFALQWGDEQKPRQRVLAYWLETLMVICGLTDSAECRWLIETLRVEDQAALSTDADAPWVRGFLVYDEFGPQTPPPENERRFADGMNVLLRRDGTALFQVVSPPAMILRGWPTGGRGLVDHMPSFMGRWDLYDDGYVFSPPLAYAGITVDARGNGGYRAKGLPYVSGSSWGFMEFRDVVAKESAPDFEYICQVQGGAVHGPDQNYQRPGTFMHGHVLSIVRLPSPNEDEDIVIEYHTAKVQDPIMLAYFANYKAAATVMSAAPLHEWHCHAWTQPTIEGKSARWLDSVGRPVGMDVASPEDAILTAVDEKTLGWTGVSAAEKRWEVRTTLPSKPEYVTACFVFQRANPKPVQAIPGGVLVGNQAFIFNDVEGPRLGAPYAEANQAVLQNAHLRASGFATSLPEDTDVLFFGLDPEIAWKANGALLGVSENGVARANLPNGRVQVTADGVIPEPDTDPPIRPDQPILISREWEDMWTLTLRANAPEPGKLRFYVDGLINSEKDVSDAGVVIHSMTVPSDGTYGLTFTASDVVGNESQPSDAVVAVLDHLAPAKPDGMVLITATWTP